MAQHFLLSAGARSLSAAKIMRMSDTGVENVFLRLRWPETDGKPVCPDCGCTICYACRRPEGQLRWRCKACRHDFSITSGTLFAWHKLPLRTYDARGNVYATTTPAELMARGIPLATNPADAARSHPFWARQAVDVFCRLPKAGDNRIGRRHDTDGLLVGPFGDGPPFSLLIVNTDGTLAERSGNGLTIFARSLADHGLVRPGARFSLWVHHDKDDVASPTVTEAEMVVEADGSPAFWLDLGVPLFGPDTVGAHGPGVRPAGGGASRVARLAGLDPSWSRSVFVRIGNPHCVTFVPDATALPEMEAMCLPTLHASLAGIAFSPVRGGNGDPCPDGVNLQWAAPVSGRHFVARVFERGEGPTASSGTSAAAIACAAWHLGLARAGRVAVEMPGGVAPLNLAAENGALVSVRLFGTASAV